MIVLVRIEHLFFVLLNRRSVWGKRGMFLCFLFVYCLFCFVLFCFVLF